MRRFVPPVPRRSSFVRLLSGMLVAAALALTSVSAQIPGRNVNMVAGTEWPNGDPYLQRQNEPSIAASTRNPLHLLAGSNDYRTVDVPGMPTDEIGDAWLGLYKSFDGGQRWTSTLLPGYPQDQSAVGQSSPIFGYAAGADPVVRAGTNGLMYYAGLAFNRSNPATPDVPGKSAIFVARFIDNNNKEAGDTFHYLGTRTLQTDPGGTTGNFLDKPWMVVDIPRDSTRCTIVTADSAGNPVTQRIPAGPVYVAYTVRSTDRQGPRYDVMFTSSTNCGSTWSTPARLNSTSERANQGATMAIDPRNGNVYVTWRQFDLSTDNSGTDALMVAKYTRSTRKVESAKLVRKFEKLQAKLKKYPKLADLLKRLIERLDLNSFFRRGGISRAIEAQALAPLDQSTSATNLRFRTNAYPSLAVDETGRVYMAWAERGFAPPVQGGQDDDSEVGAARILVSTSADGQTWSQARPVSSGEPGQRGHQLMPSLTYAGGKLMLIYYDIRETRSESFTQYVEDKTAFDDPQGTGLRHTMDVRASMASRGATPAFAPSVKVSEYLEGPRVKGGPSLPWQVNPPNLPMFQKGTAPFMGDYIDVTAAPNFVLGPNNTWTYNTAASSTLPIFHAAWTDNRDVRVPLEDSNNDNNPWNDYTPPSSIGVGGTTSRVDPTQTVPLCVAGNEGSRNQNVYTARITGGLLAGSPGNTKRLGYRIDEDGTQTDQLMQRTFVVFAQNTADPLAGTIRRFRFTINNQPAGGSASFDQFSQVTSIDAEIPYRTTASRTVYATSTNPNAVINISVTELELVNGVWTVKTGGLGSVVILNPDIDNPDIDNPDIDNPDIDNPDIDNVEVFNPDIDNPDIDNPDIDNPDIDNPDIDNPDIDNIRVMNPDIDNPDIDNPDIDNPDIDNPDIDNPDIDNPDIDNPDIDNASLMTDVTWNVTNTGNTTATYNINLFFAQQTFKPEIRTQLILYRTYKTPVVKDCRLYTETRNVLVANVPNPQLVLGSTGELSDANDPSADNATIYLAPGESARITFRIFDPDPQPGEVVTVVNDDNTTALIPAQFVPNEDVTPVVQQQGVNTEDVDDGVVEPPVVVQFPAPQAAEDTASTAENTPVKLNVLANDSTAFGSTKIISFHPAGMAAHSGGFGGDAVFQPSTGYVYTQRGAVDPASNTLVGRFPVPPTALGVAPIASHTANLKTGINYGRVSAVDTTSVSALDARPDEPTFHRFLPMPVISGMPLGLALDATHGRLYVVHSPAVSVFDSPSTVSVIDVTPGSPTFHQIVKTVALPLGLRPQSIAVNSRTERVYVAATSTIVNGGGVFWFDGALASPVASKVANTTSAWGVIVNEAANTVFASSAISNVFAMYVIDGTSSALTIVPSAFPMRFGSNDERLAVHESSGKVYMRLESVVTIFDGQRGSPSFGTFLSSVNVGRDGGLADIAVDQELGRVITVGNASFHADIIDVASNSLISSPAMRTGPGEVTIDPISHRAYVTLATYVQEVDLALGQNLDAIAVFIEGGSVLLNPSNNKAYVSMLSTAPQLLQMSGAGLEGPIADPLNLLPDAGRLLFSEWHAGSSQGFIVNTGNPSGTGADPGSVIVVDGATNSVSKVLETPPNPFGIGIDQSSGNVFVATLGLNSHGTVITGNANALNVDAIEALGPGGAALPAGFNLNGSGSLLGFGRHVVVNPATHKVYTLQTGGSPVSLAVLDPSTNRLTPLDGQPGTPIFDELNSGPCGGASQPACNTFGRAGIVRVDSSLNRVFVGYQTIDTYTIVVLDGSNDSFIGSFTAGGHSNRHTPSYIAVNQADDVFYVTNYLTNTLQKYNSATLAAMGPAVALPLGPSAMALNNTARRIYVSSIDAKTLTAIDAATMTVISTVQLPLVAYFLHVDEVESRIYTSGGDSSDESGTMIVTDVLGKLGTDVSVSSVGSSANGSVVLNPADNSVTFTPNPGFAGLAQFTYNITAPTGTAVGTAKVTVRPSSPTPIAFGDTYQVTVGQQLEVPAPGPMANDAAVGTFDLVEGPEFGDLGSSNDGEITYTPDPGFTGVDTFRYRVLTGAGNSNTVTVRLTVTPGPSFVVTNTNNGGANSLRAAINAANLAPHSTITFDIPGPGVHTIQPTEALPPILSPMTINGYSQGDASPNTGAVPGTNAVIRVRLLGTSIPPGPSGIHGLHLLGGGATIQGLAIGGFSGSGIFIDVSGGNVIAGNFIGTDASGNAGSANAQGGITVQTGGNTIGGTTFAARNLISGNAPQPGVRLQPRTQNGVVQTESSGTVVKGNLIGTNAAGTAALANSNGVQVNSPGITIGGDTAPERNVISGNTFAGISSNAQVVDPDGNGPLGLVAANEPSQLIVRGNYVGLQANGTAALANQGGGVTINGSFSEVRNNVISGNSVLGINVSAHLDGQQGSATFGTVWSSGHHTTVAGNIIGLNAAATAAVANTGTGVSVSAADVTIGGSSVADRNVIAGNTANGISLNNFTVTPNNPPGSPPNLRSAADNAIIQGNYIGVDGTGNTRIANTSGAITASTSGVRIGGPNAGEGNLIVLGNNGISLSRGIVSGTPVNAGGGAVVQRNTIGLLASGSRSNGGANGSNAVSVQTAGNQILDNVISGNGTTVVPINTVTGVIVSTSFATGNTVRRNLIGTNAAGVDLRNTGHGVQLQDASTTTVGGAAVDGNTMAFNGQSGLVVAGGATATGNALLSNRIYANAQLGIDLNFGGVTANDAGDGDAGPNTIQNFPVLTGFTQNAVTQVTINTSSFAVAPNGYTIQFFASPSCDASGNGEGQRLVGHRDGIGVGAAIAINLDELVTDGEFITATATDPNNNTSEFSPCLQLGSPLVVVNTNDSGFGSLRNAISFANTTAGTETITFNIPNVTGVNPGLITLLSALPVITGPVNINGTSQPNYDGRPVIEVTNGASIANGFETNFDVVGVTIQGLSITGFGSHGISLLQNETSGGPVFNLVTANYIGTDRNGNAGKGNVTGVATRSDFSRVTNNVIAGNTAVGLRVDNDADNVTISGNSIGMVNGTPRGNGADGLRMFGSLNTTIVNNNVIVANGGWGVSVDPQGPNQVTGTQFYGNSIGVDGTGAAHGNTLGGMRLNTTTSMLVGMPGQARNVIGANSGPGIVVSGAGGNLPQIRNNYIGLDPAGAQARSNTVGGIRLETAAIVGGPDAADRNHISGNGNGDPSGFGILATLGAAGSNVRGNTIGLNVNNASVPNGQSGIIVRTNGALTIGGNLPGEGNVISGNTVYGISIVRALGSDPFPSGTVIRGNRIGTDQSETIPVSNGTAGIFAAGNNLQIGGPGATDGNVIAYNGTTVQRGGVIVDPAVTGVRIERNSIYANNGLGIDLGNDGNTPNQDGDGDEGANRGQNFPVLSAASSGPPTRVTFDTTSFAPGTYTLHFYVTNACGNNGKTWEGSTTTGQNVIGTFDLNSAVPGGYFVTATATDAAGNTSEFSNCAEIDAPGLVTNENDSGAGSLRAAIDHSNNTAGTQTITFAIPNRNASNPALVHISSASLPAITQPVIIDGTTQSGWDNLPVVEVRGTGDGNDGAGFNVLSSNVTIRGLSITGFMQGIETASDVTNLLIERNLIGTNRSYIGDIGNGAGLVYAGDDGIIRFNAFAGNTEGLVVRDGATNNSIRNNGFGVSADGATTRGNSGHGITMYNGSANNTFDANYISGNGGFGVDMQFGGAEVTGTKFWSNTIGLNSSGAVVANTLGGIHIHTAPGTVVGGDASKRNVISGNGGHGILVEGESDPMPVIRGNYVGLDASGATARGNGQDGIRLSTPAHVGGSVAGEGNVISANSGAGVRIARPTELDPLPEGGSILGNKIGTTADGTAPRGNGADGMFVSAVNVTIGGIGPEANLIAHNSGNGITLLENTTTGVRIDNNAIHGNGSLGIDIDNDGVTPNDPGDDDTVGANRRQNFPELSNANNAAGNTFVTVDTNSLADANYSLTVFKSQACDASGYGEGEQVVIRFGIQGQQGSMQLNLNQTVPVGWFITATAMNGVTGNTSEFSACVRVNANLPPVIDAVSPSTTFAPGQMMTVDGSNFQAAGGGGLVIRSGGSDYPGSYLWSNNGTRMVIRTAANAPLGPAQLIAMNGTDESTPVAINLTSTPAAPVLHSIFAGSCGGFVPSQIQWATAGSGIVLIADGVDTSHTKVVFTPVVPSGSPIQVAVTAACSGPGGRVALEAAVPGSATPGAIFDVTIIQEVNSVTSPNSNAMGLNIEQMVPVFGTDGGQANTNSPPSGTPPVLSVVLDADQEVQILATGAIIYDGANSSGPNGGGPAPATFLAPALATYSLVGRINGGPWQQLGIGPFTLTAPPAGGLLELAVNDDNYADNSQHFMVKVRPLQGTQ